MIFFPHHNQVVSVIFIRGFAGTYFANIYSADWVAAVHLLPVDARVLSFEP